jgi:hypothetical protein
MGNVSDFLGALHESRRRQAAREIRYYRHRILLIAGFAFFAVLHVLGLNIMIEHAQGPAPETQAVMLGAD